MFSLVFDVSAFSSITDLVCPIYYTHKSRIKAMEKMKINSKTSYTRNRVVSGHGPHRILEMKRQELLNRLVEKESLEKR